MLDSLTIFAKSGLILYHHDLASSRSSSSSSSTSTSSTSTASHHKPAAATLSVLNDFISTTLLDHNAYAKCKKSMRVSSNVAPQTVVEWEEMNRVLSSTKSSESSSSAAATATTDGGGGAAAHESIKRDWIAIATYPEVMAGVAGRWVRHFLRSILREFGLYFDACAAAAVDSVSVARLVPDPTKFDATCRAVLRRSENWGRRGTAASGGGGGDQQSFEEGGDVDDENDDEDDDANASDNGGGGDDDDGHGHGETARDRARAAMKNRQGRRGGGGGPTNHEAKAAGGGGGGAKKGGKEERVWHDGTGKVSKSALKNLDRSKGVGSGDINGIGAAIADDSAALREARAAYLPSSEEVPAWEEEDVLVDDDDNDDHGDGETTSGGWGSSLKGLFDQMAGNKVLTKDDLEAPLDEMKKMLTSKNVAIDVAAEICEGVRDRLVGKRMNSFGRVKTAVRHALEAAVEKVLRPAHGRDVDVLHSVVAKRERGGGISGIFGGSGTGKSNRPYTIVMIGINGVGKSTSLAKIAYYLKSNGCSPLLAACDTFRSGAVEQLNVHAKCLDVPLYHKGYAKDPAAVAKAAINHATEEGNDVVLVDTAGRMQNNVPLMKALSKLVVENEPDLVLFVCEALVGNDGIDQLRMFNKALRTGGHSRQIDGVVLTKFDTVSDKVGSALTMAHITGAPIAFVGTGQKYNHLKKLSVQSVIKSLFA